MTLSRKTTAAVLFGMLLLSFVLRAYHPLTRPKQWLRRTESFNQALSALDWAGTYQRTHPGFTTMLVSGMALQAYDSVEGTPAAVLFDWAIPSYATPYGVRMAVAVFGLALAISVLIVLTTLAVRLLSDWAVALAVGGLLTLSPVYLSLSRVMHVDALVSAFMLLSALLLLNYLKHGKWLYLVFSGLAGGFALLTKVPSLFLLPYFGLATLVYLVRRLRIGWREHDDERLRWVIRETWRGVIGPGLVWVAMAVLPWGLWPAMWVEPLPVISRIFVRTSQHISTGHSLRFFGGAFYYSERPSILFYPVVLALQASFPTLTLALSAVGLYVMRQGKKVKLPLMPVDFWLMVAYVVFFTLQMSIGAKQDVEYILPAHLMLEVLAGVGIVGLANVISASSASFRRRFATRSGIVSVFVGLAVGMQALVAMPYAPSYGAHHNQLLGGNRVAVRAIELGRQNEGLHQLSAYLSDRPDAETLRVGSTKPADNTLEQLFQGEIVEKMTPEDDYQLFHIGALQRNNKPELWEDAWARYEGSPPQVLVLIDGVPFAWLYDATSPDPLEPIVVRQGGGILFVVVAWVWTLALVGALVWALRSDERVRRSAGEPAYESGD